MAVIGRVRGVIADLAVVVSEADESGVFDAVGLGGRRRENDPLGDIQVRGEADLIVGLGQNHHRVGDRLELTLSNPVAPQDVLDFLFEINERESFVERIEHLFRQGAIDP